MEVIECVTNCHVLSGYCKCQCRNAIKFRNENVVFKGSMPTIEEIEEELSDTIVDSENKGGEDV